MKGLLLKEWYQIWSSPVTMMFPIILFLALAIGTNNRFLLMYLPIYFSILPLSTVTADEQSRWQQYSIALPYSRKQLVSAKYIVSVLYTLAAVLIIAIPLYLNMIHDMDYSTSKFTMMLTLSAVIGIALAAGLLPIFLKFGSAQSRGIMLAIAATIMAVMFLAINSSMTSQHGAPLYYGFSKFCGWIGKTGTALYDKNLLIPVILLLLAGFMLISWCISVRIVKKKEY